uniref:Integrase core domain containing protein n=1 Tax=Solanum tuberosum TaxID=4113 RepID=M1DN10_SOLTU
MSLDFLIPHRRSLSTPPTEQVDDTLLSGIFGDGMQPPDSSHTARNRPHSSRTSDDTEAGISSRRERQHTEAAWRSSIVDKEQRAMDIGVGASSIVSTTEGAVQVDISTTEGAEMVDAGATDSDPSVDPMGFEKHDPPIC